jgi:hypothetical protein
MDKRQMMVDHLKQAQLHVALGEKHIARQYDIISELERDGNDSEADQARELLAAFEEMQEEHISHRDRIEEELRAALVQTSGVKRASLSDERSRCGAILSPYSRTRFRPGGHRAS